MQSACDGQVGSFPDCSRNTSSVLQIPPRTTQLTYEVNLLCPLCQKNFSHLHTLFAAGRRNPALIGEYNISRDFIVSQSGCPVCHAIYHARCVAYERDKFAMDGAEIWIVNILNSHEISRAKDYHPKDFTPALFILPGIRSRKQIKVVSYAYRPYRENGLFMPVFSASQIPPTPYTARLLDQGQVEFGVCRYWIERCSTGHDGCRTPPPSNLPGLKVIDCQLMMLVRYPPRCHYITLSYVWGKQTSAARTVNVGDAFPERSCPRVIRDAIAVTKILGYRYLWIDRYCIDQNDAKDKESQLAIMDLIYETATLTLVAAAGEDDQHGLPGAGTQPIVYRESQPRVHIGDLTLVSTLPDVTFPIHRSRWVKRGWTYQEAMLSRRLLIFTPIQVYFICRLSSRCETFPVMPELKLDLATELTIQNLFNKDSYANKASRHFEFRQSVHCADFEKHTEMYSSRDLTFETDVMNAFKGILRRSQVWTYWGIPILPESCSLHVSKTSISVNMPSTSALTSPILKDEITCSFLIGLLWRNEACESEEDRPRWEAVRRQSLPSWTWLSVKHGNIRWTTSSKNPRAETSFFELAKKYCTTRVEVRTQPKNAWTSIASAWIASSSKILPAIGNHLRMTGRTADIEKVMVKQHNRDSARYTSFYVKGREIPLEDCSNALIDCDEDLDSLPQHLKTIACESMCGQYVDIEYNVGSLSWKLVVVIDLREVVVEGATECLVIRAAADLQTYKRVGVAGIFDKELVMKEEVLLLM